MPEHSRQALPKEKEEADCEAGARGVTCVLRRPPDSTADHFVRRIAVTATASGAWHNVEFLPLVADVVGWIGLFTIRNGGVKVEKLNSQHRRG